MLPMEGRAQNLEQFLSEHRGTALMATLGVFLLGIGVLSAVVVSLKQSEPKIEIISLDESVEESREIVVDVAGAVEEPGVYRLVKGSRVNEALVAAGGLAADADRNWVARYVNLAQELSDGIKIYIPAVGEQHVAQGSPATSVLGSQEGNVGMDSSGKLNINTASAGELIGLWGIGEKRAQAIIENRPYSSIEELTDKRVIPSNVYEQIKDEISVY